MSTRPLPAKLPDPIRPTPERRSNAARVFGYDVFISFALGPPPRGTRSYASDLARRLRERDFTVFFSEEEAPAGDQLDGTLKRALHRSRILVVIANEGTLSVPRWVRAEVEEFRRVHPKRPVIPISIGNVLQDPFLGPGAEPWLRHSDKIWIDESQTAGDEGVVSDSVLERLATAPNALRAGKRWRWTVRAAFVVLSAVTAAALWFAWSDRQNATLAGRRQVQAQQNAKEARTNAARALDNEGRAVRESRRAVKAEGVAVKEAAAARAAERQAQSGRLAAESELARQSDPRLALLLAREAWDLERTMEARQALYAALDEPVPFRLGGGLGQVDYVDYSADGRFIAVSGVGGRISIWDAGTRRPAGSPRTQRPVVGIAFSPDGRTLASIDMDGRLQLWDPATGLARGEPLVHAQVKQGFAVAWRPDGKMLAVAGMGDQQSERIVLWDVASRSPIGEPLDTSDRYGTFKMSFSPDGKLLAATTLSAIKVWDVATRQLHVPPIHAREAVRHVDFLDNDSIAFDGPGYEVTRWDLSRSSGEPSFRGHINWVGAFAHASAARVAATGSDDMTIRLWRGDFLDMWGFPLRAHDMAVNGLAFNSDGSRLVSAGQDGQVILWLLNTGSHRFRRLDSRPFPSPDGADATISDDGRWFVLLRKSGRLEWHDLYTWRKVASAAGVRADEGLAVARDGTVALRTAGDLVMLQGRGEPHARCTVKEPMRRVLWGPSAVVFSPDSRLLVTVEQSALGLWRTNDCHAVATLPLEGNSGTFYLVGAAFSADGRTLLVSDQKGIRRWNLGARRFDASVIPDPGATCLATDAEGRFIASGHTNGVVRLTRLGSNAAPILLQGPHGHTTVRNLAFSPDGLWLASVADDGQAVLWDLTIDQPIGPPIDAGHGQLRLVAFSANGRALLTRGIDGVSESWDLDADMWAAQACRVAQRNLTCAEWQRVLGAQPYRKTCQAFPLPDDAARCGSRAFANGPLPSYFP